MSVCDFDYMDMHYVKVYCSTGDPCKSKGSVTPWYLEEVYELMAKLGPKSIRRLPRLGPPDVPRASSPLTRASEASLLWRLRAPTFLVLSSTCKYPFAKTLFIENS